MSLFRLAAGAVLLSLLSVPLAARENAYDVVGKVLAPFAQVLAGSTKTKDHAFRMQVHLEEASEGEKKIGAGTAVDVAVQMPDRLRITAPLGGEQVTICRDGQKLWAYPGSRVKALLADPAVMKSLPEPDRKYKLEPFSLPIPEKQLAFLPVLFKVEEAPDELIDGERCRVLDLQLQKELAKSFELKNARARIWVGDDDRLRRMAGRTEQGEGTLRIDDLKFRPALPPETWQPTAEQSADVAPLSPAVYDQIVRGLMGRGKNE